MQEIEFELKTEYIDLLQLLKATDLAMSGGEAKMFVDEEMITVNGELEHRKRRKLRVGDVVVLDELVQVTLINYL
jgi:ribosome-associated protein